ncbi:oxidoreductase [Amycolatopsis sp. NPDC051372]|uniref:oxidoreductase n=1 Tax=unclassified Amycolatopsis TaxID=2618356 RepID=UPI0034349827
MYTPTSALPDEFVGRRVLVTGGSRGIGAAIAQRLIDGGAVVATSARTKTDETPKDSTFLTADLRSAEGARELIERAANVLGGLDILVNAAGAARTHLAGPAAVPDEEWLDSLNINFLAAVRVTNAALPALKESGRGAAVVNISTGVVKDVPPPVAHYAAAKAALNVYSRALAKAVAPEGIRVNIVSPGPVETEGGLDVLRPIAEAMGAPIEAVGQSIPLGRFGDSRDIAEIVAFLASARAQWITGADFDINGGQ